MANFQETTFKSDLFDKQFSIFDVHQVEQVRKQLGEFAFERPHSLHGQWSFAVEAYLEFYGFLHAINSENVDYFLGYRSIPVDETTYAIATHYWRVPQSKSTVFLMHGLFDHVGLFQRFIGHLIEQGYSVVSMDLPGHGLSSGEPAVIDSFGRYTRVLENTMTFFDDELKGQSLCAIGQSTGAAVLMLVLFDHARRQSADANAPSPFDRVIFMGPLLRPSRWHLGRISYFVLRHFVSRLRRDTSRPNTHDRAFHHFLTDHDPLQSKALPTVWVGAMKEWIDSFDAQPKVSVPLLIVQGTDDHVVDWRRNTKKIQQYFTQSELSLIEGARHHLLNEALPWRKVIYASMSRFLRGRSAQAAVSTIK